MHPILLLRLWLKLPPPQPGDSNDRIERIIPPLKGHAIDLVHMIRMRLIRLLAWQWICREVVAPDQRQCVFRSRTAGACWMLGFAYFEHAGPRLFPLLSVVGMALS